MKAREMHIISRQAHSLHKRLTLGAHRLACRNRPILHSPTYVLLYLNTFTSSAFEHQRRISITFLTDVEGDGSYFDRYIENSNILTFQSRKPCFDHGSSNQTKWNLGQCDEHYFPYDREVVFLEEDGMLVYGGDVWDKGGADLYVIRQLLSLQQRYPDRVHFLMGNRDINKLRIVEELGVWSNDQKKPLPVHGGVYWLRGTNMIGDPDQPNSNVPDENRSERLKWMLAKTMGSVDAFELRRKELGRERAAIVKSMCASPARSSDLTVASVTDDEVTESYMLSCDPNYGIMSQYLIRAKLIIRFGPALFMHGALPFLPNDNNDMRFPTPWPKTTNEKKTNHNPNDLADWIQIINHFAADQIKAWQAYGLKAKRTDFTQHNEVWATKGGYSINELEDKPFGNLLQYGMNILPDRTKNPSVVYSSWMKDGMPRKDMDHPFWSEFLTLHGLQVVATGHQPVGDMPWPIQICSKDVSQTKSSWILPCDTSFSADTNWVHEDGTSDKSPIVGRGSGSNGRGDIAVCETLIKINPSSNAPNSVTLHGYLSDGTRYETKNLLAPESAVFGKPFDTKPLQFMDGNEKKAGVFWSKVNLCSTKSYRLASYGKGFNVWNTLLIPKDSSR